MYKYKVVRINAGANSDVNYRLNEYAKEGWKVKNSSLGGDDFIFLLEIKLINIKHDCPS